MKNIRKNVGKAKKTAKTKAKVETKTEAVSKTNMVFLILEAVEIAQGSRRTSEDLFPYGAAYASYNDARDALREVMREAVNAAYEGCDDDNLDIDKILDDILDSGDEYNNVWTWDCSDRSAVWKIVCSPVNRTN